MITGASKGIGLAAARTFYGAGYRVINLSRSTAPEAYIESRPIDLSEADDSAVRDALRDVEGEVVVVHNAAFMAKDSALDCDGTALQRAMQVNIVAPQMINKVIDIDSSISFLTSSCRPY